MNTMEISTPETCNDNDNTAAVTIGNETYNVFVNAAGNVNMSRYQRVIDECREVRDNAAAVYKGCEKTAKETAQNAETLKKERTAATRKYNAAAKNGTKDADELRTAMETATEKHENAKSAAENAEREKIAAFDSWTETKKAFDDAETAYVNAQRVNDHIRTSEKRRNAEKKRENMKTAKMTRDIDVFRALLPTFDENTLNELKTAATNTQRRKRQKISAYRWQLGGTKPISEMAYKRLIDAFPQYAKTAVEHVTDVDKNGELVTVKTYHNREGVLNVAADNVTALCRIMKHNTELSGKQREEFAAVYANYSAAVAAYHTAILSGDETAERDERENMQTYNAELQRVKKQIEKSAGVVSASDTVAGAIIAAAVHDLKERIEKTAVEVDFNGAKIHAVRGEIERRRKDVENGKITAVNAKHGTRFKPLTVWDVADTPE